MTDRSQPREPAGRGGFIGQHAWAPYFLVILTVGFYAGNHVVARAVHNDISPMALVFWRSMGAAIVLAPFVARPFIRQWPLLRRNWKLFLVLALLQVVLGQSTLYVGLQTATALNAGFINATMPALTIAFAWLLAGESVSRRQVIGLIVATFGVLAIIMRGDFNRLLALAFVPGRSVAAVRLCMLVLLQHLGQSPDHRDQSVRCVHGIDANRLTLSRDALRCRIPARRGVDTAHFGHGRRDRLFQRLCVDLGARLPQCGHRSHWLGPLRHDVQLNARNHDWAGDYSARRTLTPLSRDWYRPDFRRNLFKWSTATSKLGDRAPLPRQDLGARIAPVRQTGR